VVSGPNTGGKTVLLKAVGLLAALAQSGIIPPAGPGTTLPLFTTLYADIGDRQSIRESLSTFSAHLTALRQVLDGADRSSLVLLDEVGTGTDPAEGAALASAALRALARRGCITLASTHLGALKELAGREPGVVNASLEFDAASLAPTFRFTKGVPGRSYGLAIARRLGLDESVLAQAEAGVPDDQLRLEAALSAVEARRRELECWAAELAGRQAELAGRSEDLARQAGDLERLSADVARREKALERAVKSARRDALLAARVEVERALELARDGKAKEARRALEAAIHDLSRSGDESESAPGGEPALAGPPASLMPGLRVRIRTLGLVGEVESVRGEEVAVRVRGRRLRVRARDLAFA
jgi:DNA mismatch repair protein MutS2